MEDGGYIYKRGGKSRHFGTERIVSHFGRSRNTPHHLISHLTPHPLTKMAPSRRNRNLGRFVPYAKAAMRLGAKLAGNRVTKTWTKTKKNKYSGGGVTTQHDKTLQYKRKPAPRRLKKKYRRQAKAYTWNLTKSLGTTTAVRNATLAGSWIAGATTQFAVATCLYGLNGTGATPTLNGFNDVATVCNLDGTTDDKGEKVLFTSAVMDLTYTNTSTVQFTQEVDIYEIIFIGQQSGTDILTDYNECFAAAPKLGGPSTAITDFSPRGVTPFECPIASAKGYRVIKKTKYFVSAGQSFTYQYRDPGNHWMSTIRWLQNAAANQYAWKNVTRTFLFVAKPVIGTPAGNAGSFSVGCTRKYAYKTLSVNKDYTSSI